MSRALICLAALALAGCGSNLKPEPEVRIQRVEVPVTVSCVKRKPVDPDYPDTDEAILEAADPAALIGILGAGRVLREQFIRELKAAYSGCD